MFEAVSNVYNMQVKFRSMRRWNNRTDTALNKLFNRVIYNYEILVKRYKDHDVSLGIPDGVLRLQKDFDLLERKYKNFLQEVEINHS